MIRKGIFYAIKRNSIIERFNEENKGSYKRYSLNVLDFDLVIGACEVRDGVKVVLMLKHAQFWIFVL